MALFNQDDFVKALSPFIVSYETLEKLSIYENLLKKWQKTINLVSNSTLDDIWQRHFLDSAQLVKYFAKDATRIIDFGSGAGFPALVYATLLQAESGKKEDKSHKKQDFHIIESDSRKCAFMREVARNINTEVTIHNARIEQVSLGSFDIITARALTSLDGLLTYARPFITNNSACVFLKGKAFTEELSLFNRKWQAEVTENPSLSDKNGKVVVIKNIKEL